MSSCMVPAGYRTCQEGARGVWLGVPVSMVIYVLSQVELKKAEVRWMRHAERLKEERTEAIDTEMLFCKFQGILNKLTEQRFQALAEQALQLEINTLERLRGCINKIFSSVSERL